MPWLIMLVFALASSGCASLQYDREYDRVKPGELHGKLVVQWIDPDKFIFVPDPEEPLSFSRHNQETITPGVMYTDGGSIPRPLWSIRNYSPWGYAPAYIIHDWLFEMKHCQLPGYEKYDADEAALVLAEVMKTMLQKDQKAQPDKLTFYAIYEAVRSPIAQKAWDSGKCNRVPTRGGELAPLLPRTEPKMEYVIEFP